LIVRRARPDLRQGKRLKGRLGLSRHTMTGVKHHLDALPPVGLEQNGKAQFVADQEPALYSVDCDDERAAISGRVPIDLGGC